MALRLADLSRRSDTGASRTLEQKRAGFGLVVAKLTPNALRADLRHAQTRMAPTVARLRPLFRGILDQRAERLGSLAKLLESYSYKGVLARGFALVLDDAGHIVSSKDAVRPGQVLVVEVADGSFGAAVSGAPVARKKPRPPKDPGGQESLF